MKIMEVITVALAPIDVRNPKKPQPQVRYQGDIVPPVKPQSTEKRGVKGRPGQRPMPDYDVTEDSDNPKYFGATQKVKINKQGIQTPLNKRGFGA